MTSTARPPDIDRDPGALVGGVLLAAGAGTRFGGPKAVVRLDGETLASRGARVLADAGCAPVVVVIGARADAVRAAIDVGGAEVVENAAWASGMGSSLAAGLAALRGRCAAAVVALADQPLIGPEAVRRLVTAWRAGATVAVATYGGSPRNPVLLDAAVWDDALAAAGGDRGARDLIRTRPDLVTAVACDDVAAPTDIDTPDDLAAIAISTRNGA
jgi:CTP:molybdopterin cytidylyltransferase MocA